MKKLFTLLTIILVVIYATTFSAVSGIPRNELLIAQHSHGRVTVASNFNIFTTAWRYPARGIHQLMIKPLWMVDPSSGKVINVLAETSPIYNEDFTEMTVKLRKGIYWSDGVEFTADDVVYGVKLTIKFPGMSYHTQLNKYVEDVAAKDKYTVVFKLKQSYPRFHTIFLDRWGCWRPFPKHIFEKVSDPVKFDFNPPISIDAYVLKDYDRNGYWFLFERREDWERTPTGILYGKPTPKYILFQAYDSPEQMILAMRKHELDVTYTFSLEVLRSAMRSKTVRAFQKDFPWISNVEPTVTGVTLNTTKFPFNIRDVRWALTLAINVVEVADMVMDGAVVLSPMHVPPAPVYNKYYYQPLEDFLKNFELDIMVNGDAFKPFDSTVPLKLAELAKKKGYKVSDTLEEARKTFGIGWWKYAPDVAAKLLERHGFKRDKNGKWLLPDGTPWKIEVLAHPDSNRPDNRTPIAVAQQWKKFGIDVTVRTTPDMGSLVSHGKFDVSGNWPAVEPWGGHPDLFRTFDPWRSEYQKPVGEYSPGHGSHWSHPKMDEIIKEMEKLGWDDPKNIELGKEGLKLAVLEMPSIPIFQLGWLVIYDEYYWTNWSTGENPYVQPVHSWPNFGFELPFLKPTGRK